MKLTKQQMKVLAKSLDRAATLSWAHADAVERSANLFEQYFGEVVPEECFSISGGDNKNEVGSLFSNFVNYGENMSGDNKTAMDLVQKMNELMNECEP